MLQLVVSGYSNPYSKRLCDCSEIIWNWFGGVFIILQDSVIIEAWMSAACASTRELWFIRSKICLDGVQPSVYI